MLDIPRKDYYGILRLPFGASDAVIRQRFRRLAKRCHPDVNPSPDAAAQFRTIREAYDVLTDPARRAVVDSWHASQPRPIFRRARPMPSTDREPSAGSRQEAARAGWPEARWAPSPRWATGGDRTWNFGCFSLLAFAATFISALSVTNNAFSALLVALLAALVVGTIAAVGGDRVREGLLWILAFFWW